MTDRPVHNPHAHPLDHPLNPDGVPRHRIVKIHNACYHTLAPENRRFARPLAIPAEEATP